jgi:hypothetical protein
MIEEYKAAGWAVEPINIVTDVDTLAKLKEYLDFTEVHSAYILVSEVDRLKLLSGDSSQIKVQALHQAKTALWNKQGVYSQGKKITNPNYKAMPYSALVGSLKVWFGIDYIKQKDADYIMNPAYVFTDGNPRPYPYKLATVKLGKTNYIITTHEMLRPIMENIAVPSQAESEVTFQPILDVKDAESWFKFFMWSSPEKATKQLEQLKEAAIYKNKYNASIIRLDREPPEVQTQQTAGLDRIQESTNSPLYPQHKVKIGFIQYTEIPVLVEKTLVDKNAVP